MRITLRPYQEKALDEIRGCYRDGIKKVLLHLATGAGKTAIFCEILKSAKAKGTKAIMVVRGKALVDQASLRLTHMDVPHGVMQANHWRRMPDEPIQICSIDTLYRRRLIPPADLIVIDEAHLASSESYLWLCKQYPHAFFLPVSATPHVKKGLRHVADKVVYPITMKDLIREGYLVPATYFLPSKPNLDGVEIDKKTHDYKQDQLEKRMRNTVIYGHLSHSYKTYGQNRPALAFAVTVEHSLEMVQAFNAAGIPSAHMEADTSMPERVRMIKDLEEGRIKIISNVGVLTTGVDIPCASCIILARPTKSYNLYIQILGRGTRTFPGKENFIVLDHASNVPEHGFIETERVCNLDGKEGKPVENSYITCDVCWHTWNPIEQYRENNQGANGRDYLCRLCGRDMTPVKAVAEVEHTIITAPSEMVEVKDLTELETAQMLQYIEAKYRIMRLKGYKKGWIYYQLREKFGETNANRIWSVVKKRLVETPS